MKSMAEIFNDERSKPIGVFDSGLGGIAVLKELIKALPDENFVYFGDTANVPYGEKTNETILNLGRKNIDFLVSKNSKLICVACGTVSSLLEKMNIQTLQAPIFEIITPTCIAAIKISKSKKIGVIATNSAINAKTYLNTLKKLDNSVEIFQKGCPKFVEIIENQNMKNENLLNITMNEYLSEFKNLGTDTLILGCTHFPIIKRQIDDFFDHKIKLIDPGIALAQHLKHKIQIMQIENPGYSQPHCKFFVSSKPQSFNDKASKILGKEINLIFVEN